MLEKKLLFERDLFFFLNGSPACLTEMRSVRAFSQKFFLNF